MKLSVMQENLARGLAVVSRAVSSRSTLPVLANVLLEDRGRRPEADRDEPRDRHHVLGAGQDRVRRGRRPSRRASSPISSNSLPAGDRVDLELQPGDTLHLQAGRFETNIKGIDADEFPAIQAAGERPTTRIAQNVLRRALAESHVRGRQRRGPADPDRRPRAVRGRSADARRRRQLPDRGPHDARPRRRARRRAS